MYPTLKPGVLVLSQPSANGKQTYVGFGHRAIVLHGLSNNFIQSALALFDGKTDIASITKSVAIKFQQPIEESQILSLIDHLRAANFIEFSATSLQQSSALKVKPALAQNQINFRERLSPEINISSWQPDLKTSARQTVIDRANFSILIFGSNRLAISLFSLLQASGFSSTKIIDRIRPISKISADLACGGAIKTSDIGLGGKQVIAEIKRNSQLNFDDELPFPAIPSFIIATSDVAPDYIQRWMSEAIPHLLIGNLVEGQVELGPIVIPGKTPCYRCLELHRSEQNPNHQKFNLLNSINPPLELSAAAVATIAGLAVLHTCELAARKTSQLIAAIAKIDLLNPLSPQMQYWQPNPACGCQ